MTSLTLQQPHLPHCGVYGFDEVEPLIFAALITEDPLMLLGPSGTGKTYLLNTLSEVMGLEHRHYNASLVAFDDLVGFPFPDQEKGTVEFLQTPATIWGAQSVLIDEISRCKPEHQNRLFALIHERRIQGLPLTGLKYRWAAMNPPSTENQSDEDYIGSEPLDPALADRFSLFIEAKDWKALDDQARAGIANPAGEGKLANDEGALNQAIKTWQDEFGKALTDVPPELITYAQVATDALLEGGIRLSPRRVRLLVRSLLATTIVTGEWSAKWAHRVLQASIPQIAWGADIESTPIQAAHDIAWAEAMALPERWVFRFLNEKDLCKQLAWLDQTEHTQAYKSQAMIQLMTQTDRLAVHALAYVLTPAVIGGGFELDAEAIQAISKLGSPILDVDEEHSYSAPISHQPSQGVPRLTQGVKALANYHGVYKPQIKQFLIWASLNHRDTDLEPWVGQLDRAFAWLAHRNNASVQNDTKQAHLEPNIDKGSTHDDASLEKAHA